MIFNQTIHPPKNGNRFLTKSNFRKTNLIYRKIKQKTQVQVINLAPVQQSATLDIKNTLNQITSLNLQKTSSNFMKQYIDKLKRQRKRSHKKIELNNPRKQSMHSAHYSPEIFILQKIPKTKQYKNQFNPQKISFLIQQLKRSKNNKNQSSFFEEIEKAYHTEKKSNKRVPIILDPIKLNERSSKLKSKNAYKMNYGQVQPWKSQRDSQDFSIQSFCK